MKPNRPVPAVRRKTSHSRAAKAGLPPGSLVYVGNRPPHPTHMSLLDYDEHHVEERDLDRVEECLPFKDKATVTWINVDEIGDAELMASFGRVMGFHPLMLEDILNTDQRPKVEDHGDYLYVVLKMLAWNAERGDIDVEQLSLVVGANYVVSFGERKGDYFDPLRARIREAVGRARKLGADFLAYSLLDMVVDHYFIVLERLGEKLEQTEDAVMANPGPDVLAQIHRLKRDLIFVRKAVWPLREAITTLRHLNTPLIAKPTGIFLRDLNDHVVQVIEGIETYQNLVASMLDTYLSTVSNRTNAVMRVLAVFSAVFMPLTFITGIFGMNFRDMPPLEWGWGFAATLGAMLIMGVAMVLYFRSRRWI
ncbi:MAG: magnesium/cobalt transporter CorA [Burkholderiales bacterium]|nr:magnesium/cobalt transporter CorA [Burkholderiales bacterium]